MDDGLIYLDNAATSFPKPESVYRAMDRYAREIGASPGRSGHSLSLEASRSIYAARELLARLFSASSSDRVCFTLNATESLNLLFQGLLKSGDRVVTTSVEHNSVARPLNELRQRLGLDVQVVRASPQGLVDPDDVKHALQSPARLVAINHASNVTGALNDIAAVSDLAGETGAFFAVDAAQTAGAVPIDAAVPGLDFLAFSGHKSLYGPQGTGGFVVSEALSRELEPLKFGGTGSNSEHELQPDFLPDRYESGTPNGLGIAGLAEGVRYVLDRGVDTIRAHEIALTSRFRDGLENIDGVKVHGPPDPERSIAVVSIILEGLLPSDAALVLDRRFGVLVRPGLQCAPSAHRTIGTFPAGTVRFSFSAFNTTEHVDAALEAIPRLLEMRR